MIESVNNKILVSVEQDQKDFIVIAGNEFRMANIYETNYRIKSPVIATVVQGNDYVRENDILLCHHNLFYLPSPYHIEKDLFSIPFSKVLFAKILEDGSLLPICGNILGERIDISAPFLLPSYQVIKYNDRLFITHPGFTKYKKGQTIFSRPSACYDIVYHSNKEQKSITKISDDMICGILL